MKSEIASLVKRSKVTRRKLQILNEQASVYPIGNKPAHLQIQIEETEKELEEVEHKIKMYRARAKSAYSRIFRWFKKNQTKMLEISPEKDEYSKFSKRFIATLPTPKNATQSDMLVTGEQVLMGLLEWAYHMKDKHGKAMHEYARIILANVDPEAAKLEKSRLSSVLFEFRKKLRN